ncbi:helix-turn-helix domain-containing protein [Streptomyces sp. NPDC004232]|uniref:winged helix-turn-helix transcriptional regulator n=1 Tax=Streptomyces sp. NPDC004232 TaxID=3154454 RepID=UPI0033B2B1D1
MPAHSSASTNGRCSYTSTSAAICSLELINFVGGISRKVLARTLRRLESYGLIERRACAEAPPTGRNSLTDLGHTLPEPVAALTDWAKTYGAAVANFQEAAQQDTRSNT